MSDIRSTVEGWFGLVAGVACLGFFGLPVVILGGQVLDWLKRGEWTPFPFGKLAEVVGVDRPMVDWLGFQKLIDWFFALPATIGLCLLGAAFLWCGGIILDRFQDR